MAPLLLFTNFVSILKEVIRYGDIVIFIIMLFTSGKQHLDTIFIPQKREQNRQMIKHVQYCSYV